MDRVPLCFYGIQGDLQCSIFIKKDKDNQPGAFNAQGEVEKIIPFNTVQLGAPKKPIEPNIEVHAPVRGVLHRTDPTFVGMYQNAKP
jgi:hypothetical protein